MTDDTASTPPPVVDIAPRTWEGLTPAQQARAKVLVGPIVMGEPGREISDKTGNPIGPYLWQDPSWQHVDTWRVQRYADNPELLDEAHPFGTDEDPAPEVSPADLRAAADDLYKVPPRDVPPPRPLDLTDLVDPMPDEEVVASVALLTQDVIALKVMASVFAATLEQVTDGAVPAAHLERLIADQAAAVARRLAAYDDPAFRRQNMTERIAAAEALAADDVG